MDSIAGETVLWYNQYIGLTITERYCPICDGDLVIYTRNGVEKPGSSYVEIVKFCNSDLGEMLPTMNDFVARKKAEDGW